VLGHDRRRLTRDNGNQASWLLIVWTLARIVSVFAGWKLDGALVTAKCVACWDSVPISTGCAAAVEGGHRFAVVGNGCTVRAKGSHLLMVGGVLDEAGVIKMLAAARRACGGTRSVSPFCGLPLMPAVPYMHTTGNIVKALFFHVCALLRKPLRLALRSFALKWTGKSGCDQLFFREFIKICAAIVAFPSLLGDEADGCLGQIMAIASLFCQAWTAALYAHVGGSADDAGSAGATRKALAALRIASTFLVVYYRVLKPMDPKTKDKGVYSLYLHGAAMHLEEQLKDAVAQDCKPFTDHDTEGGLRRLGAFLSSRSSNTPWAAVAEDWATSMALSPNLSRAKATEVELQLSVKSIRVCRCVADMDGAAAEELYQLFSGVQKDFRDAVNCIRLPDGTTTYHFTSIDGANDASDDAVAPMSSGSFCARALRIRSAQLDACWCGVLTRSPCSSLATSAGCRLSTGTAPPPPLRRSASFPELPRAAAEDGAAGNADGADEGEDQGAGFTGPGDQFAAADRYAGGDGKALAASGMLPSPAEITAIGLPVHCVSTRGW